MLKKLFFFSWLFLRVSRKLISVNFLLGFSIYINNCIMEVIAYLKLSKRNRTSLLLKFLSNYIKKIKQWKNQPLTQYATNLNSCYAVIVFKNYIETHSLASNYRDAAHCPHRGKQTERYDCIQKRHVRSQRSEQNPYRLCTVGPSVQVAMKSLDLLQNACQSPSAQRAPSHHNNITL